MAAVAEKWLDNDRIAEHCDFWMTFIAHYLQRRGEYKILHRDASRLAMCEILANQNRNYLVKADFIARQPSNTKCPFFGANMPSYNGQLYLNPKTFRDTVIGDDAYFLIPADPYVIRPKNNAILNEEPGAGEPYTAAANEHFFQILYKNPAGDDDVAYVYIQGRDIHMNMIIVLLMNAIRIGGNTLAFCDQVTDADELGEPEWDIYGGNVTCFQLGKKNNSTIMWDTQLPDGFTAYVPNSDWGNGRGPIRVDEELSEGTPLESDDELTWPWSDNE